MGRVLGKEDEMDDVLIRTGHLPQLPTGLEKFMEDPGNLRILSRAYREMTGDIPRQGYIEIIQRAAASKT